MGSERDTRRDGFNTGLEETHSVAEMTTAQTKFTNAGQLPPVAPDAACAPSASDRAYGCEGLGKVGDKVSIKAAWEWAKAHPYETGFAISLGVLGIFSFGVLAALGIGMIETMLGMGITGTIVFYAAPIAAAAVGGAAGAAGGAILGEGIDNGDLLGARK